MRQVNKSYTVFVIKPDAVKRKIVEKLEKAIMEAGFLIIKKKEVMLEKGDILQLYFPEIKEMPNNIKNRLVKRLVKYLKSGKNIALLCRTNGYAIKLGSKLKGDHYLPVKSSKGTLRHEFRDKTKDKVEYKMNGDWIVDEHPGNVIHAVASEKELKTHMKILFPDFNYFK